MGCCSSAPSGDTGLDKPRPISRPAPQPSVGLSSKAQGKQPVVDKAPRKPPAAKTPAPNRSGSSGGPSDGAMKAMASRAVHEKHHSKHRTDSSTWEGPQDYGAWRAKQRKR
ncbi:hypothetical protein EJ06DRAFT_33926 [Trichodelitschia bisporula]|uniref:Uncharacterized protein n=1 Tax=Trichodelitschia bisporula TaxID=703511 RepID=A0A6G1HUT6_9PEZI|nr:hypothetical protein EJ06DRAFT_33926 [Trichodelitschia bisporula]